MYVRGGGGGGGGGLLQLVLLNTNPSLTAPAEDPNFYLDVWVA